MKRTAKAIAYALLLTLAINAPTIAGNVGLDREAVIQVLNALGVTTNGVYSGGSAPIAPGSGTATSTGSGSLVFGAGSNDAGYNAAVILGPGITADGPKRTMIGGSLRWPTGYAWSPGQSTVIGPDDTEMDFGSGAGQNLFFAADIDNVTAPSILLNSRENGGAVDIRAWIDTDGNGGRLILWPVTTVGVGKAPGWISVKGAVSPETNGIAALGSSSLGFAKLYLDYTNTATIGAVQIDKPTGRVNVAANATTVTVTNNLVTAASHVLCIVSSNDATAQIKNVVSTSGSFTIHLASATAQTSIDFFVLGAD